MGLHGTRQGTKKLRVIKEKWRERYTDRERERERLMGVSNSGKELFVIRM